MSRLKPRPTTLVKVVGTRVPERQKSRRDALRLRSGQVGATKSEGPAHGRARAAVEHRQRRNLAEPKKSSEKQRRKSMKILMVLTSHDQLGNTGRKTGLWLEEFAAPYFVFRDAGVELTLASPKGGQPPIDPKSDSPDNQTHAMARINENTAAQTALSKTSQLADMRAEDFDTIFYVG